MNILLFALGAFLLFFDLWFILKGLGNPGIGWHVLIRSPWLALGAYLIYVAYKREKQRKE